MRRLVVVLALAACDDGGGETNPPVTDMAVPDRGIIQADMAPADQGAGGEPADGAVLDMATPVADMGPPQPDLCDESVGYGLQAPLAALEGAPRSVPRAVWTGSEWGVMWQAPSAENPGVNEVWFRRFDASGTPVGEPALLGLAKLPQQEITWNGGGFVAVWLSSRTAGGGIDGIKVQLLGVDGTPTGPSVDVPSTFDVAHLDAAWSPGAGGMIVYTRGMAGAGGLFAVPLDESGTPGAPMRLSETETRGPTVAYGDGSWGAAWLDRASGVPSDLVFVVLNDRGQPISQPRRQVDAGAQGAAYVAYGQGTYGVGWSKVNEMGQLGAFLTLFDSAGDLLATPPVPGAEGFGLVTDVAWLDPNTFGVAWQDNGPQAVTVGLSRVNTSGVVANPLRLVLEAGHAGTGLRAAGNLTRAGIFYVDDPMPAPGGGFSAQARILTGVLGPCDD